MRNNDVEFEYNTVEDGYIYVNEDKLEKEILSLLERNADVDELHISDEISREAYLSLSKKRQQVISWYPFKETDTVLEIGAGFGELTECLETKVSQVHAYELKKERAEIIRKRAKKSVVYTGFFEELEIPEKFDVCVLHDITAFTRKFVKADNPDVYFLEKLGNYLKPTGKLIIIVENRLGMKYFAGAVENYSRQFFWGLNSFEQDERFRTFSKRRLQQIIEAAGFEIYNWYYPYPDAIMTNEVFHDNIEEKMWYGIAEPDLEWDSDRFEFFNEQRMFYEYHKSKIASQFANAFIVECGRNQTSNEKLQLVYKNFARNYSIKRDSKGVFWCKDVLVPPGKCLDIYLMELIEKIVDCNLGNRNPYIKDFYAIVERTLTYLNKKDYYIQDFFVLDDNLYVLERNQESHSTKEHRFIIYYEFYIQNIMKYRNAYRRLPLKELWKVLDINDEELSLCLFNFKEKRRSISNQELVPRYPSLMFEFDAEDSRDLIYYNRELDDHTSIKKRIAAIQHGIKE